MYKVYSPNKYTEKKSNKADQNMTKNFFSSAHCTVELNTRYVNANVGMVTQEDNRAYDVCSDKDDYYIVLLRPKFF